MSTGEPQRNRAGQIRVFTVQACVSLVAAVGFAILDRTTDLNSFAGMWVFTVSFVLAIGAIIWRRRRPRSDDR